MEDKYTIGNCPHCGKYLPLKNGVCKDCQNKKIDMPDFMKEAFGEFDNGDKHETK